MNESGYNELRNAVVLNAVKDYTTMLRVCKKQKIKDPKKYREKRSQAKHESYTSRVIRIGLDAEDFLRDEARLSLYTQIDGTKILNHLKNA